MKSFSKKTRHITLVLVLIALLSTATGVLALNGYDTTTVDSAGSVGYYTSLALNSSGFPVISYYDTSNQDLKVAICNDATCSSPTLTTVDSAGFVGLDTSLALNSSGFPVISYYDVTNGDLKVAICNDATCSSPTLTTVDSAGFVGDYTSLALNSSGFPVISYYDGGNYDLKVAICNDAICSSPTLTTVDSAGFVGEYTSLALNSSGFPVISYLDATNTALKVALCNDASCSSPTLTTVDSAGFVGLFTSLALNSSGFPVISYLDATNTALKVALCNDASCSSPTLTTVDSAGFVGLFTSLALNSSGFPVISYYDVTNGDLKVAICNDATCSSPTLTTVDSAGSVGSYTSLALNSSGFPVISYFDISNGDLKVATPADSTAPSVLSSSPADGTALTSSPTQLTVTFDEDVKNDASAGAANTIANYLLVEAGVNGSFDTVSCLAGVATDDTKITITNASYTSTGFISTLTLGSALPAGSYRLFVCGTTSIEDLAGNELNDGASDAQINFTVQAEATTTTTTTASSLPATGFRHGQVTSLPKQPAAKAYTSTELTLEIPVLGVSMPIVGVPQTETSWDVTWLGNSAGWLNGSAFPTWAGNTVMTGHVWDAYNQPGPFAELKTLKYGDQFTIQAYGMKYTYEVRESKSYWAKTAYTKVFQHEELDWVTLLTCETYNPFNGEYLFRRAVRAVLVSVK